uniref:Uncharacterized protein n=1 Tax=Anopheles atroparvus TaxID=41427 RepID=A0A182IQU3_ANOAO
MNVSRNMSMTHHHHHARRRTMARNLLLPVAAGCLLAFLIAASPSGTTASAIPAASFPPTNGIANSASADAGHRRATSCVAVHPILQRRGVDQIDMPIDPIPGLQDSQGKNGSFFFLYHRGRVEKRKGMLFSPCCFNRTNFQNVQRAPWWCIDSAGRLKMVRCGERMK